MKLNPFKMERWQAMWENRVRFNLSESGDAGKASEMEQRSGADDDVIAALAGEDPASPAISRFALGVGAPDR